MELSQAAILDSHSFLTQNGGLTSSSTRSSAAALAKDNLAVTMIRLWEVTLVI